MIGPVAMTLPAARIVLLLAGFALAAATEPVGPTFCARLAPQAGMKPAGRPADGWRVNLVGGLRGAMLGGSSAITVMMHALDDADAADQARLNEACKPSPKGMVCRIEGPGQVQFGSKNGEARVNAAAGERALIEMRGTVVTCKDQPST